MAKIVNQTELAEIHGVTDVTIWSWQKEGMPIAKVNTRGLSNEYDVAATIEWREARAVKKVREESPRDALARAQTKLIEQQLAEKSGALVPIAEIEPGFARMVVNARQRLLQIPGLLQGVIDETQANELRRHLEEALQELSRYDPSRGTAAEGGGPLGSAGAPGGGEVGGDEADRERQVAVPGSVPPVDQPHPAGAA